VDGTASYHLCRAGLSIRQSCSRDLYPHYHKQKDAPDPRGRLHITPLGGGRFTCTVTRVTDKLLALTERKGTPSFLTLSLIERRRPRHCNRPVTVLW